MSAHPTTYPTIDHPLVVISHRSGKHTAQCGHCDWSYTNTIKTDVETQARYHRGQHRDGRTTVTP
jgi:hypothetical protein